MIPVLDLQHKHILYFQFDHKQWRISNEFFLTFPKDPKKTQKTKVIAFKQVSKITVNEKCTKSITVLLIPILGSQHKHILYKVGIQKLPAVRESSGLEDEH